MWGASNRWRLTKRDQVIDIIIDIEFIRLNSPKFIAEVPTIRECIVNSLIPLAKIQLFPIFRLENTFTGITTISIPSPDIHFAFFCGWFFFVILSGLSLLWRLLFPDAFIPKSMFCKKNFLRFWSCDLSREYISMRSRKTLGRQFRYLLVPTPGVLIKKVLIS
jgi:hypothetical protein